MSKTKKPDFAVKPPPPITVEPSAAAWAEGKTGSSDHEPKDIGPRAQVSVPTAQASVPSPQDSAAGSQVPGSKSQELASEVRRGMVVRAKGGPRDRLSVYVAPEIGERLRHYCFRHHLEVSEVLAPIIGKFVTKLPE